MNPEGLNWQTLVEVAGGLGVIVIAVYNFFGIFETKVLKSVQPELADLRARVKALEDGNARTRVLIVRGINFLASDIVKARALFEEAIEALH